jgi:hypothetical protein
MLTIYAGSTARAILEKNTLSPVLFDTFLGASGGPKWFVLFGLDKYLWRNFFVQDTHELNLLGSSAGAFRAACFAQTSPVDAITRLATLYSETVYSTKPTPHEITQKAIELLHKVIPSTACREIINNKTRKAHFILAKTNGLVSAEQKWLQLPGLLESFVLNTIDRKFLRWQYQRIVFQAPNSNLNFNDPANIPTQRINLTTDNLASALLASGSIPLVMEGVNKIPHAPKGMYRDGGIIDYHFDLAFNTEKLVLYPHFNHQPFPGWFDKNIKRYANPKNYHNVVMLCPSERFIQSLPYQKIPDREDFTQLDTKSRIKYWQQVLVASEQLAECFDEFLAKPNPYKIKPLAF